MAVQPHKAIVGANAFQHESGIHQDGMIKNKQTYEIMTPEHRIDAATSSPAPGIVLGKHSGRNAVSTRLNELGYDLDDDKLQAIFVRFKEVAERKKAAWTTTTSRRWWRTKSIVRRPCGVLERVQVTTGSQE